MAPGTWLWLTPALFALFLYGIAQGLVKKYIAEVPPARFCLFFFVARSIVMLGFWSVSDHPPPFAAEGRSFLHFGLLVYAMDGLAWILYFKSILLGPISIVGTLSAAYPALTVVFAALWLPGEKLTPAQYVGVACVIAGCVGLSYEKSDSTTTGSRRRWIPLAIGALVLWGAAQAILKHAYSLPLASEVNVALFATISGGLTLGAYGLFFGRGSSPRDATPGTQRREWLRAIGPMVVMASGDLAVIIATKSGPVSIVAPLTAAYPVVTIAFAAIVLNEKIRLLQYVCIALVLMGMFLTI